MDAIVALVKEAYSAEYRHNHPHPASDFSRAAGAAIEDITWAETHGQPIDSNRLMPSVRRMIAAATNPYYTQWSRAPWFQPRIVEIGAELAEQAAAAAA